MMRLNRMSGKTSIRDREAAFTLIELLLAISLLSMVVAVAYSALSGMIRTKIIVEDKRESRQIANSVLTRLSRELQLAYPNIPRLPPPDNITHRFHQTQNILGERQALPGGLPGDSITFVALEAGQYMGEREYSAGAVQLRYYLAENPEGPRFQEHQVFTLVREEVPYIRPFERAYEQMIMFPISERVLSLEFRYFDGKNTQWVDSWGADTQPGLPDIIEFTLQLLSDQGIVDTYTTSVPLRAGR